MKKYLAVTNIGDYIVKTSSAKRAVEQLGDACIACMLYDPAGDWVSLAERSKKTRRVVRDEPFPDGELRKWAAHAIKNYPVGTRWDDYEEEYKRL